MKLPIPEMPDKISFLTRRLAGPFSPAESYGEQKVNDPRTRLLQSLPVKDITSSSKAGRG
jgi:hypothetical protein